MDLATISSAPIPDMTQWPWRRSDRTFLARDLDLHRTLSGRLRTPTRDGALGELSRAAVVGVESAGE